MSSKSIGWALAGLLLLASVGLTPDDVSVAMVRALKWLRKATAEDVAKVVPREYLLGDRALAKYN